MSKKKSQTAGYIEEIQNMGMEMQTCTCCEKKKLCSWGVNPYNQEMYDDETKMWICNDCVYDLAGEI